MTASGDCGLTYGFFHTRIQQEIHNYIWPTEIQQQQRTNSNWQLRKWVWLHDHHALILERSTTPRNRRNGTFNNREGNQGEFTLNFESECVFSGEYWYNGQTNQKYPWHGICSSGKPRPAGGWGCRALTASCLAQSSGMLVEEYCVKNPNTLGCPFKNRR